MPRRRWRQRGPGGGGGGGLGGHSVAIAYLGTTEVTREEVEATFRARNRWAGGGLVATRTPRRARVTMAWWPSSCRLWPTIRTTQTPVRCSRGQRCEERDDEIVRAIGGFGRAGGWPSAACCRHVQRGSRRSGAVAESGSVGTLRGNPHVRTGGSLQRGSRQPQSSGRLRWRVSNRGWS